MSGVGWAVAALLAVTGCTGAGVELHAVGPRLSGVAGADAEVHVEYSPGAVDQESVCDVSVQWWQREPEARRFRTVIASLEPILRATPIAQCAIVVSTPSTAVHFAPGAIEEDSVNWRSLGSLIRENRPASVYVDEAAHVVLRYQRGVSTPFGDLLAAAEQLRDDGEVSDMPPRVTWVLAQCGASEQVSDYCQNTLAVGIDHRLDARERTVMDAITRAESDNLGPEGGLEGTVDLSGSQIVLSLQLYVREGYAAGGPADRAAQTILDALTDSGLDFRARIGSEGNLLVDDARGGAPIPG